jgi:predicted component of type VI protein secretion system
MTERTTVRLPDDLVRRAKRKAAAEGRSLTSLIEEGLRRILNERTPGAKASRVLPPVSSAIGGVMPGSDLSETTALQEMEDLEYAERLK